jgi:hypothetical protein
MDAPYENPRTTSALRLINCALQRGFNVNVFAYEGAVGLGFAKQTPHANAMHGRDVVQEDHPNPKEWVAALQKEQKNAARNSTGFSVVCASTSAEPVNAYRVSAAAARPTSGNLCRSPTIPWSFRPSEGA